MHTKARLIKPDFGDGLPLSTAKTANHSGTDLHGHDFYELDIIVSGCAVSRINGKSVEIRTGTVLFMTPADFHDLTNCSNLEIYNVHFVADTVSTSVLERLQASGNRRFIPSEETFGEILEIFLVVDRLKEKNIGGGDVLPRLLESILLLMPASESYESTFVAINDNPMQKALLYVHEHFRENPSLATVASRIPLDERYFCSKFREYTGVTYKEYLREQKLRYARRLLLVTNKSVEVFINGGIISITHWLI